MDKLKLVLGMESEGDVDIKRALTGALLLDIVGLESDMLTVIEDEDIPGEVIELEVIVHQVVGVLRIGAREAEVV